jgi:hypothetical protein
MRSYRLAEGPGSSGPVPSPHRTKTTVSLDFPAWVAFQAEVAAVEARLQELARDTAIRAARGTQTEGFPVTLAVSVNDDEAGG